MKFKTIICPECGEVADGTLEQVPGIALINFNQDGEGEYSGETKILWEGQQTEPVDDNTKVTLICAQGHEWTTEVL